MLRDVPGRRISNDDAELFMNAPVSDSVQHHQNDLNDDIFGSAPSSPTLDAQPEGAETSLRSHGLDHPSDVARLRSLHVTNGYREGIAISKEQYIQAGFDEGYGLGGEIGLKAGWCLGALDGVQKGLKQARAKGSIEATLAATEEVLALVDQAQSELKTEVLFSSEYFTPEGISVFGVQLREGQAEDDVTVSDIAAAHPLIAKWTEKVHDVAQRLSLDLRRTARHHVEQ